MAASGGYYIAAASTTILANPGTITGSIGVIMEMTNVEELLDKHRNRLLRSVISKSESLNQANLAAKPAVAFASSSRGAQEYDALCEEVSRMRL